MDCIYHDLIGLFLTATVAGAGLGTGWFLIMTLLSARIVTKKNNPPS